MFHFFILMMRISNGGEQGDLTCIILNSRSIQVRRRKTRLVERVKLAHIISCAGEISRGSRGEYRRNGSVYLILWPRLQ